MVVSVPSETLVSPCLSRGERNESGIGLQVPACAPSESLICGASDIEVKVDSVVSVPAAETVSSMTPISTCSTSGSLQETFTVSSETPVDVGTGVGSVLVEFCAVPAPPSSTQVHSLQALPLQSEASVTSVHCHSSEVDVEMVDQEAKAQPASKVAKMKRKGKSRKSSRNSGSRKNSKKASLESVAPSSVLITGSDVGLEVAVSAASEASVSASSNSGIKIGSEGAEHVALTLPSFETPLPTCNESEFETEREG